MDTTLGVDHKLLKAILSPGASASLSAIIVKRLDAGSTEPVVDVLALPTTETEPLPSASLSDVNAETMAGPVMVAKGLGTLRVLLSTLKISSDASDLVRLEDIAMADFSSSTFTANGIVTNGGGTISLSSVLIDVAEGKEVVKNEDPPQSILWKFQRGKVQHGLECPFGAVDR